VSASIELSLPRDGRAPALARDTLAERIPGLDARLLADAQLAATELVTNALEHGRGAITMLAALHADRLHLEVIDEGDAAPVRQRTPDDTGGWGLHIVDALSRRWGSRSGTTHVWCELARRRP
jgi:anti-sigma regulatory factor (Ser/Thr protein kinase)